MYNNVVVEFEGSGVAEERDAVSKDTLRIQRATTAMASDYRMRCDRCRKSNRLDKTKSEKSVRAGYGGSVC